MKRNIKTMSVAAMAALAMVSCSNHDDFMSYEDFKAAEYEMAFVQKYGQIDPNHTWGFSNVTTKAAMQTRSIIGEINDPFTNYDTSNLYATEVPAGVEELTSLARNDIYVNYTEFALLTGTYSSVNLWQGSRNIYIKGDVTFNNNGTNQAKFYVLPGATLTLNGSYINDVEIYVSEGATLNLGWESLYKQTGGGIIFNHGIVNLPDNFKINQDAIFYNEGTVNGVDITSKPGDGHPSYTYNYGELTLTGEMVLNSCANFYNEGTVSVDGETNVTQQNIWWINKGHYTTGSMIFSAKNATFYNYCQLLVEGNAHMYDGEFNLMAGSYIEAATADFDNFIVNMGENSGFNIKGDNTWAGQGDGTYQGFKATGANAYVRLGGTTTVAGHLHSLELTGKITYAIKEIVDLGAGNSGVQPTYVFNEGTIAADFDKLTVTPSENDCGATWENKGTETPKKEPEYNEYGTPVSGRIFCEDLGSTGDFDFNDVVFDADIAEDNSTTVVLRAAGGIYDITVAGVHIHEVLGDGMVNTGVDAGLVKSHTITLGAAEATAMGISYAAGIGSIPVKVYATTDAGLFTEYELRNKVGGAPQKICVGKGTKWVKEYIDIVDAYPSFKSWVQNYQTPNTFTDGVESNLYQDE